MLINVEEAAKRLGCSVRRVRALIASGRLAAQKIGRPYVLKSKDVDNFKPRASGAAGHIRKPKRSKKP